MLIYEQRNDLMIMKLDILGFFSSFSPRGSQGALSQLLTFAKEIYLQAIGVGYIFFMFSTKLEEISFF